MDIIEEHIRTVTTKGQVTIPIEIRRLLGVKPQDKVVFQIRDGKVELHPVIVTLEDAFGSILPLKKPLAHDKMRHVIEEERAERWLTRNT